jgi:hypothetical protein
MSLSPRKRKSPKQNHHPQKQLKKKVPPVNIYLELYHFDQRTEL